MLPSLLLLFAAAQVGAFQPMYEDKPRWYKGPFRRFKQAGTGGASETKPDVVYRGGRVWWQPMDVALLWYGPGWDQSSKAYVQQFINDLGRSDWWTINTQVSQPGMAAGEKGFRRGARAPPARHASFVPQTGRVF